MKKYLSLLFVLFAFNAKGQTDPTINFDTIPKIALVTNADDNIAGQVNVYVVMDFSDTSKYNYKTIDSPSGNYKIRYRHVCYLTEDKKPIPSHWVIWQVK